MDQCFFGNFVLFQEIVLFGLGGILSCSSSTCALCFFLPPITFDLRNIKWQGVPQKLTQNIHDCASDACLSHQNPVTASIISILCHRTLSLSLSFLLVF